MREIDRTVTVDYQQRVQRLIPLIPVVISIHGALILFSSDGQPGQWLLVASVTLLGVLGITGTQSLVRFLRWRLGYYLLATWLLMLTTGGVTSVFIVWLIVLVSTYPLILKENAARVFILSITAAYIALFPFSEQPSPVLIMLARAILLVFIGRLVQQLSSVIFDYASQAYQMRRKLQEEHDLLRTVIDSLPDYIYTKDLDGRYTRVNAAQLRILGAATIEAVIGKTDHDLFPEYLAEQIQREEQEILQSGQPLINREESIIDRSSGRRRWVLTSKAPVRDDSGQNIRIVGIIRDITDSKRAEEKRLEAERLQIKLEKEKEVLDLKEQFLSVVSHEFRTPLAVIKSAVDLLQRYFDRLSPEKHQKYIQNIATRTDEMIELLNDVLIISKARASKTEFKLEPIDLEGFCSDIVEQLQGTQGASHRLVFTSRGQFENGHFDTRLLRHILINLLSNAIKYSPTGSDVLFDLTRENDRAVFLVKDRGIGIPSHDLEQLYEPFFRATNTGSIGGTGLGLAIVYESVMTHGGTIACESTEGEGATFTIHLPIVSSPDQHDDD